MLSAEHGEDMNKRLERIRMMIPDGRGVIDVGTDHGYLPVQLAKDGYGGRIYASDIRPGPLSAAEGRAAKEGVRERITFFLCDGLDACPPQSVDVIVIAGMGGDTICGILDRAEWCMSPDYLLILQPMTKAEVLRFWLVNNGFRIETETLVREGENLYQILSVRFQNLNTPLSDAELYLGARRADPLYAEHLLQQRARLETSLAGMRSAGQSNTPHFMLLSDIVCKMNKMEEELHDNGF